MAEWTGEASDTLAYSDVGEDRRSLTDVGLDRSSADGDGGPHSDFRPDSASDLVVRHGADRNRLLPLGTHEISSDHPDCGFLDHILFAKGRKFISVKQVAEVTIPPSSLPYLRRQRSKRNSETRRSDETLLVKLSLMGEHEGETWQRRIPWFDWTEDPSLFSSSDESEDSSTISSGMGGVPPFTMHAGMPHA